jgi:hypothetical protein
VKYEYQKWTRKNETLISARCLVFDEIWPKLDAYFVFCYGNVKEFQDGWILVDETFIKNYPQILPDATRFRILEDVHQRS